ncbi:MPE1, zinc knuckle domain-containing protein MPE1 [Trichoderma parareesei]|uniref:MPE1, zinc knuckle domain-containing protein MPE1 n=1 Tax=Trichoderma parareesei TaxID=858221 RepID=A0A2H2ZAN7_TRIPA|nr:MPE1, zinc knuckle domain-containing protein MPE1 [Trichoderma parareesei]
MSSSVFFKFKSQKEPTRVEFDGTGISVFELKREIINKSGLGDGTDFDLFIYTDDNSEEYDDDTTIVPRSTTVIARRQPAIKPGAGRAARYVSGKMPVAAKNAGRKEQSKASASKPSTNAFSQMNDAMTEEDRMAAMFAAQTEQWSAQQEELSHQAPVPFKPGSKRPANVPDHDPPNGYICYRCGNKGHWIQLCPTNDDPDFDNRPRVKRTTGIPRSFLQKVDKSVILAQSEGDDTKRPSGIMVNAEGDFVIAEPDKASWEQFQAKAKSSSAAAKSSQAEDKEVQERGLECSIDKKMFIEPMKTPCCQKTFCNDCITNALIESDFVCPACQTEGVLIDDLQPDEEASKKIQEYLKEKEAAKATPPSSPKDTLRGVAGNSENDSAKDAEKKEDEGGDAAEGKVLLPTSIESPREKSDTPATATATEQAASASKSPSTESKSLVSSTISADGKIEVVKAEVVTSKKRPAEDFLENPKIPKGPRAMQNQQSHNMANGNMMPNMPNMGMNSMMFNGGMGMMPNMMGMPGMGGMGSMGGMGMNMGMNMGMGMGMPMMNMPMMGMQGFNNMNGGYGNMNGGYGMNNMNNMNGMNNMGGGAGGVNGNWGMNNMGGMNNNNNNNMNGMGRMGGGMAGGMMNGYQNGGSFPQAGAGAGGDEDAYFRKPVNPHRHQNKQRRVRPSDYREL